MTEKEYRNMLTEYDAQCLFNKRNLAKQFALSNNTVVIGDIITDHIGSIVVSKISVSIGSLTMYGSMPQCVYDGIELLKSGKENAKGKTRSVWQSNISK